MLYIHEHTDKEGIFVTGQTSCGTIRGVWKSAAAPVTGKAYLTELTLGLNTEADRKSISVVPSHTAPQIRADGNRVIFTALCEDIDDVYYLRFADDALEMLCIKDDDGTISSGDMITFSMPCDEIGIYPY